MHLPLNWLRDFLPKDFQLNAEDLVTKLMEHSCEIEAVINKGKDIKNVIIGKITKIDKHPDADKLVVCMLDTGKEQLQIVTGAKNVKAEDVVPVAIDGASLPGGLQIKTSKLRGVLSQGMLCSEKELALATEAEGILILPPEAPLGMDIRTYLGLDDTILELGILPNRGDLLSIRGIAREVCALYELPLQEVSPTASYIHGKNKKLEVINESQGLCKRYMGAVIKNIKIAPSPLWLQNRLKQVNINPINNIVDITNYVMIEYGQPLHAFTYELIKGSTIKVRLATVNEEMVLLNDEKMKLNSTNLVIADKEKPIALAGIMGGKYSSIIENTVNIVLESALFDPVSIRKSSFLQAVRTESSQRFEKGVDFYTVESALKRAIALTIELAGGVVDGAIVDEISEQPKLVIVPFEPDKINRLLGTNIESKFMASKLTSLGFILKANKLEVPSFRSVDVYRQADIAEEVGRLFGYNNVKPEIPVINDFSKACQPYSNYELAENLRQVISGFGANEIISYSMVSPDEHTLLFDKEALKLKNPISQSESVLRTNLAISLIKNLSYNNRNLIHNLKTFEIGRVFHREGTAIAEQLRCAGLFYGARQRDTTAKSEVEFDFYDLKGIVEETFKAVGIKKLLFKDNDKCKYLHPYRSCIVYLGKDELAVMGEIHPLIQKFYDLRHKAYYYEMYPEKFEPYRKKLKNYKDFPLFPTVKRDISFWIDQAFPYENLIKTIEQTKAEFLKEIVLLDIYRGNKYGEEKINIALSLVFQNSEGTLNEDQINTSFDKIVKQIESKLPIIFA